MKNVQHFLFPSCIALLLFAVSCVMPSAALAKGPSEAELDLTWNTLMAAPDAKVDNEPVKEVLFKLAWARLEEVVADNDIERWVVPRYDELTKLLRDHIEKMVQHADTEGQWGVATRENRLSLLQMFSSQQGAIDMLAGWLRLPYHAVPSASQIDYYLPEGKEPPLTKTKGKPPLFKKSIVPRNATEFLKLGKHSQILKEYGGAGSENGVLDAGEWAHISFKFVNVGKPPLFSTSAWFVAPGDCVWTPPGWEHELGEMAPGQEAGVAAWFYFTDACSDAVRNEIRVELKDTQRFPGPPQRMALDVAVRPRVDASLVRPLLDSDIPGFSDGMGPEMPLPERRFELSAGIRISVPGALAANMLYALSAGTADMFRSIQYRHRDLHARSDREFDPADDVDGQFVHKEALESYLGNFSDYSIWYDKQEGGGMWIMVETNVFYASPNTEEAKAPVTPVVTDELAAATPEERARAERRKKREQRRLERQQKKEREKEERRKKGDRTTSPDTGEQCEEEEPYVRSKPVPVKVEKLIPLVKRFTELATRPAVPELPDSIEATDGYELEFDTDGFAEAYLELYRPRIPVPPKEEENALVQYRFRHFLRFELPAVEDKPAPVAHPVAVAPPPPPPPKRTRYLLRLDLGAGAAPVWLYQNNQWNAWNEDYHAMFIGDMKMHAGKVLQGTASLGFGAWRGSESDVNEFRALWGISALVGNGRLFEFQPRLMIGLQYRYAANLVDSDYATVFNFEVGGSLRAFPTNVWGLFMDLSYGFSPDAPNYGIPNSTVSDYGPLIEGTTFRFLAGISFRFLRIR